MKITERQALEALWKPGDRTPGPGAVAVLVERTGQPAKVCLRKVEKLVERGYADYGVSPHYAWRTEKGDARLRELAE